MSSRTRKNNQLASESAPAMPVNDNAPADVVGEQAADALVETPEAPAEAPVDVPQAPAQVKDVEFKGFGKPLVRGTVILYARGGSRFGEYIPENLAAVAKAWNDWRAVNGRTVPEFVDAVRDAVGSDGAATMLNGVNLSLAAVMGTRPDVGADYFDLL